MIFLINFIFLNSCTSETTEYCENLIVFHSIYSIFYASISSEYFSKTEEFCNSPKTKNHTTLTVHHIKIFYQDFFCVCVCVVFFVVEFFNHSDSNIQIITILQDFPTILYKQLK